MLRMAAKIVTRSRALATVLFAGVMLLSSAASAYTITSITVRDMAGVTTPNYPLTFGMVFREGDVSNRVFLNNYPTQTDVKTTWPDGSIRHAVISALIPISANSYTILNINTTGTAASPTPMSKTAMLGTDIGATIALSGLSGSGYSGNLVANLRNTLNAVSTLDYWLEGSVVSEVLLAQTLNNSLNAAWEVRFYPGTNYIRISHAIENVDTSYRGNINYAVAVNQGHASPVEVYSKPTFQHNFSSRWRKVFWLGETPPEVEVHYDLDYLIATGMVMPYDTTVAVAESTIAADYVSWQNKDTDIMGNGFISKYFPTTGGRPEIGIQPEWVANYLLTFDNRYKEMVLGNGNLSGSVPIHFREGNSSLPSYNRPLNIDDRPTMDIAARTGIPSAIGIDSNSSTGWTPDRAHQGSFAYVPYLVTGEKYYLDEMLYWASWNLGMDDYGRDGHGNFQNFSSQIGVGDGSNGIIYDQMRGFAWALRSVSDAGVIAPDAHPDKAYFLEKAQNNIDWMLLGNSAATKHGMGFARLPRERENNEYWPYGVDGPWFHDFVVLVLADMSRKYNYADLNILMATFGEFTVGRFTKDPSFNKWDGAAYWYPFQENTGSGYFRGKTWADYWSAVLTAHKESGQGLPNIGYVRYDSADSYLLIAKAALSQLIGLDGGASAYSFVQGTYTASVLNRNPTWALVPTGIIPTSPPSSSPIAPASVSPPSSLRVVH